MYIYVHICTAREPPGFRIIEILNPGGWGVVLFDQTVLKASLSKIYYIPRLPLHRPGTKSHEVISNYPTAIWARTIARSHVLEPPRPHGLEPLFVAPRHAWQTVRVAPRPRARAWESSSARKAQTAPATGDARPRAAARQAANAGASRAPPRQTDACAQQRQAAGTRTPLGRDWASLCRAGYEKQIDRRAAAQN